MRIAILRGDKQLFECAVDPSNDIVIRLEKAAEGAHVDVKTCDLALAHEPHTWALDEFPQDPLFCGGKKATTVVTPL